MSASDDEDSCELFWEDMQVWQASSKKTLYYI